jgi:hypothetical protein
MHQPPKTEPTATLRPFAVPMKVGLMLLGNMSRARAYQLAAQGRLDLRKDGARTTITLASIDAHNAAMPPCEVGLKRPFGRKAGK